MPSRSGRLVVAVATACLLAGCQAALPTTTPVPTFQCTPEAGGAEFGCSQRQYDDMVAKDKLYAEAEAVYRKFLAEDLRISRLGGVEQPTSVLLETTSGAFLKSAMDGYRRDVDESLVVRGGDREIRLIARLPGSSKGGSVVAIRSCLDGRTVKVFKKGKYLGNGLVTQDDLYFGRVDSLLKLIGADGKEVSSCV